MGDNLIIKIGANAKSFDDELKKLKDKTKSLEGGLAKVAKISAVAFAGLATAIGVATKKFTEFEKTFTNVQTLLDKSSFKTKSFSKGVRDLKNDVLSLGASSGESFETLNKGLFDIVSAGVDAEQSISVLTAATELATAGATNTAVAVDGLTSAMNAYGLNADQANSVAQKFFLAQKAGKTTVEELATGFGKVGATAKAFGVSLDEVLASVSAVTLGGVKTKEAYTGLNAVLAGISAPTQEAAKEAERLGIAFDTQALRAQGLKGFLDSVTTSANFNEQSLEKLFSSVEAKKFVFGVAGQQAKSFADQLTGLSDKSKLATSFQDALATKQETVDKTLARLGRSYDAVIIQLGERFVPLLKQAADALSAVAVKFNSLTEEQKDSIANFLKWGTIITAGITTVTTIGLAIIKVSALLGTLGGVLFTTGGAASAFWIALTGPVGLAVAGFAAVTAGAVALYNVLKGEPDDTLEGTISKLDELKEKQVKLEKTANTNRLGQKNRSQQRLDEVNDEIKKLEELKTAREKANNLEDKDFGTGSLVLDAEVNNDIKDPLAGLDKNLGQQDIGLDTGVSKETIAKEEAEKAFREKAAADKLEAERRVRDKEKREANEAAADDILRAKNEQEILKAQQENANDGQLNLLKKKHELEQQENLANKIKSDELRALELENIKLQKEALLIEEQEYQIRKAEELKLAREEQLALDEELQAIDEENRNALNEKDLEQLRGQLLSKKEAKNAVAKEEAAALVAARNQELKDTEKHGAAVAKINKFLASSEVQGVKNASNELVQLQNSKNKTLKSIGKRAAQVQIALDTARGAISAYTSLSGIPYVGPVLGAAAAAAVIAYGAERLGEVNSAQRGGIVPSAGGGSRDRVPMMLEPNELVVPKGLAPDFIQSVGRPDAQANEVEDDVRGSVVEIAIEDDATDFITAKQRENTDLAIGVA